MTGIAKPKETFAIRIGEDWHVVVPAKAREYRIEPGDSDVWMDHRSTALICMAGKEDAKISLTDDPRAMVAAALERAACQARNACLVPPDGGSPTADEIAVCDEAERRIRALIDTDHAAALEAVRAEARAEELEACGTAARLAMVNNPDADELTCSICAAAIRARGESDE